MDVKAGVKNILGQLVWLIAIGAVASLTFWYFLQEPKPCSKPIAYRIASFDNRFGLSQAEFLKAIDEASAIWEKPIKINPPTFPRGIMEGGGINLFEYSSDGSLAINLIFDRRQQNTIAGQELQNTLDRTQKSSNAIQKQYDTLKVAYDAAKTEYISLLGDFNRERSAYESSVKYWNSRGGAPKVAFDELGRAQVRLSDLQRTLEAKRVELNNLAQEINTLVENHNELAQSARVTVAQYNQGPLVGKEFEEGDYVSDKNGTRIDIYEFSDRTKLIRVLAHELGHALELEHNANPKSIMYELNQSQNLIPTAEDLGALKAKCEINPVRGSTRSFLGERM